MNQRIDHSNYEAWLLDRLEGNLTPDQERELDAFLLLYPELVPEDGELPTLDMNVAALSAGEKGSLKRSLPPTGLPTGANIDDHLIARLEGDLDPVQLEALRAYLIDHPEHQRAERIYAFSRIVPHAVAYAEKRALRRSLPPVGLPNRYNLDDLLVARLEGDLTPEQETALVLVLAADPVAQKSWKLMNATRVVASTITYPQKSALKKGGRVIAIGSANRMVRLAAAASVAAIIGLGLWFLLQRTPEGSQLAQTPKKNAATEKGIPQSERIVRSNGEKLEQENAIVRDSMPSPVQQQRDPQGGHAPSRPALNEQPQHNAPVDRDDALPMAQQRTVVPVIEQPRHAPEDVLVPEVPVTHEAELAQVPATVPKGGTTTVGELLTATVREQLLDRPARETQPLDGDDAVAAVDRGLRAVGGDHAGLAVQRKADGGVRGFNLRLGRNLAISAQR